MIENKDLNITESLAKFACSDFGQWLLADDYDFKQHRFKINNQENTVYTSEIVRFITHKPTNVHAYLLTDNSIAIRGDLSKIEHDRVLKEVTNILQ